MRADEEAQSLLVPDNLRRWPLYERRKRLAGLLSCDPALLVLTPFRLDLVSGRDGERLDPSSSTVSAWPKKKPLTRDCVKGLEVRRRRKGSGLRES
jgi:hypothetical protein